MARSDKFSTRLCFSAAIFFAAASLLMPGFAAAQRLGEQIRVDPDRLPAPYATKAASNVSVPITRPSNTVPQVPTGFTASLYAAGLDNARELAVAPDGAVLVAEERAGKIAILRGGDQATETGIFLAGLDTPSGLAFHGNDLYIADLKGVYRLPYKNGDHKAGAKPEPVTKPGALGSTGGHVTRILTIDPAGRHFTVSNGSSGNLVEDKAPRATIQIFDLDGGNQRTLATGTRNPVGTQFYPGTDRLWAVINERDGLGDGLVPDYLAEMVEGGFYGWPYSYIGRHKQPGFEGHDDLVAKARVPDLLFRAHSAPLGLVFVTSDRWPARYRGGALVALHGSWNSGVPSGYFVAFVPFADGKPTGSYEPFMTGFRLDSDQAAPAHAHVWGRPVGLAFAADGGLLVSDDVANTVWRVRPPNS
jgi:glucose/arabinose dehydrogenase